MKRLSGYIKLLRISQASFRTLPGRIFACGLSLIFAEQFFARLLLDGEVCPALSVCRRLAVCAAAAEYSLVSLTVLVLGVLLLDLAVRGKL